MNQEELNRYFSKEWTTDFDNYPLSGYDLTLKIKKDELESLEKFLELGALHEWFSIQLLKQAGVKSAKINGITGSILYQSNACTKRDIPMQKISSDLISS